MLRECVKRQLQSDRESLSMSLKQIGVEAYRYFPTQEMLLAEVALFDVAGPYFQVAKKSCPCPKPSAGWFAESENGPTSMSSPCARFFVFHLTRQQAFDGRATDENASPRFCRYGAGLIQRRTTD